MNDLTEKHLSEAIFELAKELNRGAWLSDRFGGANNGGLGVEMVKSVRVKAVVTARPGSVLVESISLSEQGASESTSVERVDQRDVSVSSAITSVTAESGSQSQQGRTDNAQSGGNKNTTINTFGEAV